MERGYGLEIPQSLEEVCDPARMALVVYDLQAGIAGQIADGARVTAQVVRLLEAARAAGMRVVFTRHMSLPNELTGVAGLRTAMAWQRADSVADVRPSFPVGSPQYQLVDEVAPLPSEAVFDKIAMSAFVGTPLDLVLRDCGLTAFAICGIATEVGIEPTVRHATDLGYLPVVVADACGAGDAAAGERSLANLEFAGGSLATDVDTFCGLLARRAT
jgi:nicotinamidase-related amidase